jgi:hypothetical protein
MVALLMCDPVRMSIRVIQWATGAMGRACLRGALDDPGIDVVGAFAYTPDKVGVDVAALVRRPLIGVTASGSIEEILAIDAEVVIHAPRLLDSYDGHDDDILRLLRSGKNVISINGNTCAQAWEPARRMEFERACAEGRSSFRGAGLNPGFVAERLTVAAALPCLTISHVTIGEVVACHEMRSREYVFDLLGFGSEPGSIDLDSDTWAPATTLNAMFEEVLIALATRLGLGATQVERAHHTSVAPSPIEVAAGTIDAGTVSRLDWCWRAMSESTPVAELRICWSMDADQTRDESGLWRIAIEGTPSVRLDYRLELPDHLIGRTSVEQLGVAGVVLHAIPEIVDAPPGVV